MDLVGVNPTKRFLMGQGVGSDHTTPLINLVSFVIFVIL